jgi:hypothetical protein
VHRGQLATNPSAACRSADDPVAVIALASRRDRYPAALLFEWRRAQENDIIERLGEPGDRLRRRVVEADLEGLEGTSYLAHQIIADKPYAWE